MLKVYVENKPGEVRIREGEKNGRKWRMVSQKVWIYKPAAKFPEAFEISLPDGVNPYETGVYTLDFEALLTRGQYDSLTISTRDGIDLILAVAPSVIPKAAA